MSVWLALADATVKNGCLAGQLNGLGVPAAAARTGAICRSGSWRCPPRRRRPRLPRRHRDPPRIRGRRRLESLRRRPRTVTSRLGPRRNWRQLNTRAHQYRGRGSRSPVRRPTALSRRRGRPPPRDQADGAEARRLPPGLARGCEDLWLPVGDVAPDHLVGDVGAVLLNELVEGPGDRMALFARRVQVCPPYLVDDRLVRIQCGRPRRKLLAGLRSDRVHGLFTVRHDTLYLRSSSRIFMPAR